MDPLTILSVAETLRGGSRSKGVVGMIGMIGVKNLLALVGALVVGFGVTGWYLGWYNIGTQTDAQGHKHVDLQVDSSKVQHDLEEGKQELQSVIKDKTAAVTQTPVVVSQPAPVAPAPTPPSAPRASILMPVSPPPPSMPPLSAPAPQPPTQFIYTPVAPSPPAPVQPPPPPSNDGVWHYPQQ
jgi:hypothetical protein